MFSCLLMGDGKMEGADSFCATRQSPSAKRGLRKSSLGARALTGCATIGRRAFLQKTAGGMGMLALASLLNPLNPLKGNEPAPSPRLPHWQGVVQPRHVAPKVKRLIWLYMSGGPSQLESFDNKPELARRHGQTMPESLTRGQPIAQLQGSPLRCLEPQYTFCRWGKSGQEITNLFPHLGSIADELCIIRSMQSDSINHDPAHRFMNTGSTVSGRPSAGSWVDYGLGSECDDLPGFVVLVSTGPYGATQPIPSQAWHSGFLPSRFQGIQLRSAGDPVLYLSNPPGINAQRRRDIITAMQSLNRLENSVVDDPEIATRIAQYEMAFRMQTSVPSLCNFADEPRRLLDLYGVQGPDGSFAANCLMARRLAERGVRFIQLYHRDWDHHARIRADMRGCAGEVDQGIAALIKDLKQRGMLDDTLVVWGGEFGRTPMAQPDAVVGRDHHIKGFTMFLAGGGVKPGITYGATDEFGYNAVENVVSVHDLHATILHLLGIDHLRLTYRFQGRDFRLTDVSGDVVHDILI
jgi:hypothetical protein